MVVLPMFAEQARNALLVLRLNIGGVLSKFLISKEHIFKGLKNVLLNSNYFVKRVTKMRQMLLDRPIPDLNDGLFYVNRLMKRRKIRQIKAYNRRSIEEELFYSRKGIDLYFVEYIFYEVTIAFILLTILLTK